MPLAVLFNHRVLLLGNICVPRLRSSAAFEPNVSGLGARKGDGVGQRGGHVKRPDALLSPDGDGVGQSQRRSSRQMQNEGILHNGSGGGGRETGC